MSSFATTFICTSSSCIGPTVSLDPAAIETIFTFAMKSMTFIVTVHRHGETEARSLCYVNLCPAFHGDGIHRPRLRFLCNCVDLKCTFRIILLSWLVPSASVFQDYHLSSVVADFLCLTPPQRVSAPFILTSSAFYHNPTIHIKLMCIHTQTSKVACLTCRISK